MNDPTLRVSWPAGGWWALGLVAAVCTVLQLSSGFLRTTLGDRIGLGTPNTSTRIAQNLVATGRYEGPGAGRLWGPDSPKARLPLRAFQIPGEALYQALWLAYAPRAIQRFAHLPVAVGLIVAIAAAALLLGGSRLALAAGLVAGFYPFFLLHGSVFDDTFLAACLDWWVLVILLAAARSGTRRLSGQRCIALALAALFTGYAVLTRSLSAPILCGVGVIILLHPRLRLLRPYGLVLLLSAAAALAGWGLRNQRVLGHFLAGSTHDGLALWEANQPGAGQAMANGGTVEEGAWMRMLDDFVKTQSLDEYDTNTYFTARARAYILSHPGAVARLAVAKLAVSATGYNATVQTLGPHFIHNLVAVASSLCLLIFGLWGLGILARASSLRDPMWILWYSFMLVSSILMLAVLILGPAEYRYRIEIDGFLMIGLGAVIVGLLPQKSPGVVPGSHAPPGQPGSSGDRP